MDRLRSRGLIEFLGPCTDGGVAVDILEPGRDPCLEFGLETARMWRSIERAILEKAFDEIEPGAVFRCEHEGKATVGLRRDPRFRLLGDMSGMIVEDQLDGRVGRIRSIKPLEEADELAGAMPILDTGMDLPGQQINARKQAQRAMALVFVVAREVLVDARAAGRVQCCRLPGCPASHRGK
jgi:hypothetical protein